MACMEDYYPCAVHVIYTLCEIVYSLFLDRVQLPQCPPQCRVQLQTPPGTTDCCTALVTNPPLTLLSLFVREVECATDSDTFLSSDVGLVSSDLFELSQLRKTFQTLAHFARALNCANTSLTCFTLTNFAVNKTTFTSHMYYEDLTSVVHVCTSMSVRDPFRKLSTCCLISSTSISLRVSCDTGPWFN